MAKLKVYRTASGFYDAYVAAPSKAAALRAWGSDTDLFALGAAELVSDEKLSEAPLAAPGTVVRVKRSAPDEPAAKPRSKKAASPPPPPPKPRPKRDALDAAEQELAEAQERQQGEREALEKRERELAEERRTLEARQRKEQAKLEAALERVRETYEQAITRWRRES